MAEDKLSWLDESPVDQQPEETQVEPRVDAEPPVEAAPEVVRDEQGRFAPKEGKGEIESAPPAPEPKEHTAPITALLDERDKRQAAERRADDFQRQLAEFTRQQQPREAPKTPDVIEDPDGFQRHLLGYTDQRLDNQEAAFSERFARKEHGDEAVNAALEAARAARTVQAFTAGPDRWERMVKWHQQQQVVQEVGSDPAAYKTRLREEIAAELRESIKAEIMAEIRPAAPSAPPPSLATAQSLGSSLPASRGSAFDNAFPR